MALNTEEKVGAGVLVALGFVAFFCGTAVLDGWTLTVLWGWFIVPIHDLPPLSIPAAIGTAIVVRFLTQSWRKTEGAKLADTLTFAIAKPLAALAIGWIVTLFL